MNKFSKMVLVGMSMVMVGCESPTGVDKCEGIIETVMTGLDRFRGTPIVTPETYQNPPKLTGPYGITFSVKGSNGCQTQTVGGFIHPNAAITWFYNTYPEYRPRP